ncbi:hypothetical protein PUN28_017688 [Cardiocondyla obscurior]|uniref:Uncharacterized protein n=1 Tax=Cardiocondyla obscurior TaxID=286306 RepID=A0AAW2EIP2_9HYME
MITLIYTNKNIILCNQSIQRSIVNGKIKFPRAFSCMQFIFAILIRENISGDINSRRLKCKCEKDIDNRDVFAYHVKVFPYDYSCVYLLKNEMVASYRIGLSPPAKLDLTGLPDGRVITCKSYTVIKQRIEKRYKERPEIGNFDFRRRSLRANNTKIMLHAKLK